LRNLTEKRRKLGTTVGFSVPKQRLPEATTQLAEFNGENEAKSRRIDKHEQQKMEARGCWSHCEIA